LRQGKTGPGRGEKTPPQTKPGGVAAGAKREDAGEYKSREEKPRQNRLPGFKSAGGGEGPQSAERGKGFVNKGVPGKGKTQ